MLQHLQRDWFLKVNAFARTSSALHGPMRLYAEYGVALFVGVLALAWWWSRGDRNPGAMAAALWAPVGVLVALGLNQPLIRMVHEARPFAVFPDALVLVDRSHDFSYPSDHTVMAGAVAAGVLLTHRRLLGWLTVAAAVSLAFARVYVGAHFPLDVVAGLLFGAAVTVVGYEVVRPLLVPTVVTLSRTPLRPLVTSRSLTRARG